MKISISFNRFIFGVVLEELRRPNIVLTFREVGFKFRTSQISKESMRNLLKYLDLDYPRDDRNEPLSYTKLTSKEMSDHVKWIELKAMESGHEMRHIAEQWERLLNQSGIYK